MKRIFLVLLVLSFACKKEGDTIAGRPCSAINSYEDTLTVGNYRLFLIAHISQNGSILEVIDKNDNKINASSEFFINLVQLKNRNDCWETNNISLGIGSSSNVYGGLYNGAPAWASDSMTKAIIQLTISGDKFYLSDEQVNK
ncbi:MAG: hypothetical protein ACK4ND_05005 [Cytophagaceae bacterium]